MTVIKQFSHPDVSLLQFSFYILSAKDEIKIINTKLKILNSSSDFESATLDSVHGRKKIGQFCAFNEIKCGRVTNI